MNTNLLKLAVFAALGALAGAAGSLARAGTEGQGGGPGPLEAYTDTYNASLSELRVRQLPEFPVGSSDPVNDLGSWCGKVASILEQAQFYANAADQSGNLTLAEDILERALEVAERSLSTSKAYNGPLAKRLVKRALRIQRSLKTVVRGQRGPIDVESRYHFLRSYVQFAKEQIASFDRQSYVPYQFYYLPCHGGVPYARCLGANTPPGRGPGFDLPGFEQGFKNFALGELQFILGSDAISDLCPGFREARTQDSKLILLAEQYGFLSYVPGGDGRATLRIAEHVVRDVAEDLKGLGDRDYYSLTIDRLEFLAVNLRNFNQNTGATFIRSEKDAIQNLRLMLEASRCEIKNP